MTGSLRDFTSRLRHDARTAAVFAHVRPAYAAGVRAALATVAPLVFANVLPGGGASWASLAGLNGALGDPGGAYRARATLMGALAVSSAVAAFVGCLVSGHLALSVIVAFVLAMLCGLARAWSAVGPGFGVAILVTFSISLAVPAPSIEGALARAGFIAAGGFWAILLAVVLWPIRPYRPVRLRITECYRSLARYLEAAAEDVERDGRLDAWNIKSHLVAVRTAIELARGSLAAARRGRSRESGRGERLLVLHELADQIYVHAIALLEESDTMLSSTSGAGSGARHLLAQSLLSIAATARALAASIESERDLPRVVVALNADDIRSTSAPIAEIIGRIADYAETASELAASLNRGGAAPVAIGVVSVAEPPPEPVFFSLAALLRPSSVVLQHALRVGIVTSVAVLVAGLLHLNHGYWVTLTAVVILQPFAATTRQKAMQRVVGTIVGGIVAAVLSAFFHGALAVLLLVAAFTMLCVALLPLNYAAYAVFGTPAFVLLAEASVGDWHLAELRIVNTLIGGGLALAGARLLWPGDEEERLPELAAEALRANDELLHCAIRLVGGGEGDVGVLREARRDVAAAASNAEDSFQRMLSDGRTPPEVLEPVMTFLIYTRRIAASAAALAVTSGPGGDAPPVDLSAFERASHGVIADLRMAVVEHRAPAPFPPIGSIEMPVVSESPVAHQRVTRLARQLRLLHSAVSRWISPTSVSLPVSPPVSPSVES